MYITEFFGRLEVVSVEGAFGWAVRCDSANMAGYAESVIAGLRNGEPGHAWTEGLFSVLTNFAVHVLSYENCGLISGASEQGGHRAIRLGNVEKDLEFQSVVQQKRPLPDQLRDVLKGMLRRKTRSGKPLRFVAVHDVAVNHLPLEALSRSNVDAPDFILIFDGHKDAVERALHRLKRRPWFVPSNFQRREFSFEDQTPWVVVVYTHEAANR